LIVCILIIEITATSGTLTRSDGQKLTKKLVTNSLTIFLVKTIV